MAQQTREIHLDGRMPDRVRKERLPTSHGFIQGRPERVCVPGHDRVETVLTGPPEPGDPRRFEIFEPVSEESA